MEDDKMTEETTASCCNHKFFELFQGKWNFRILYELNQKPSMRFGEIRKAIPGISNTVLTDALRTLEEYGLVSRTQYNEIPPHVEYRATEATQELKVALTALAEWGQKYMR